MLYDKIIKIKMKTEPGKTQAPVEEAENVQRTSFYYHIGLVLRHYRQLPPLSKVEDSHHEFPRLELHHL